ncbi:NADPH:quinone oxidoreductase family protein [Nocardia sp. CA-084685]|uniref:NADPH:quinone oxidoreductase family protein n=1 Tax=Nocardia sp. CA-084685 TaxID=3239970 RepID=UPI003D97BB0F
MLAQQLVELVGPDGLRLVDVDEPAGGGRVVVDVEAAGVSYPDLLRSKGEYQMKNEVPYVPGVEAAGIVRSAPADSGLRPGQPVAVLATEGAWQQVVAVHPRQVFSLPETITPVAAAGVLTNYLTGHFALRRRAKAVEGETVLVHGAGGGIGTAALGLCRALGLQSIAVVSGPQKADAARAAGADTVVDLNGWLDAVRDHTGGRGVDIVLDPVGGDRFTDSVRSLAPEGRLVVLGFVGGEIPVVKVNRLLLRNGAVLGAGLAELLAHDPGYPRKQWKELYQMLSDGKLVVPPPTVVNLADAGKAMADMESRLAVGKIVLKTR